MTSGDNLNPKEIRKQKNGFLQEIAEYRTSFNKAWKFKVLPKPTLLVEGVLSSESLISFSL